MKPKRLISKIALNLCTRGISVSATFAVQILLAKLLSPKDYGSFVMLQTVCLGLAIFGQAGMTNAYIRLLSEYDANAITSSVLKVLRNNTLIAVTAYCFVSTYLYSLEFIPSVWILLYFLLYLLAQTFLFLMVGWYRAQDKAHVASLLEHGASAFLTIKALIISVFIFSHGVSFDNAAMLFGFSNVIVAVLASFPWLKTVYEKHNCASISKPYIRKLSQSFLISQMSVYLVTWGGVLLAGVLLTPDQAGLLNIAQRFGQVIVFLLATFNGILAPRFATLYAKNDIFQLRRLAQHSTNMLVASAIPVMLFVLIGGKSLLQYFGDDYSAAYLVLVIVMMGQFVNVMTGSVGFLLSMTGFDVLHRNIVVTASVLYILVAVPCTYYFGLIGAACTIMLSICVDNLTAAYYVYKKLGFWTIPGLQKLNPIPKHQCSHKVL